MGGVQQKVSNYIYIYIQNCAYIFFVLSVAADVQIYGIECLKKIAGFLKVAGIKFRYEQSKDQSHNGNSSKHQIWILAIFVALTWENHTKTAVNQKQKNTQQPFRNSVHFGIIFFACVFFLCILWIQLFREERKIVFNVPILNTYELILEKNETALMMMILIKRQ